MNAAFDVLVALIIALGAAIAIRAWRHGARGLAELQRLGLQDDYPVTREQVPLGCLVLYPELEEYQRWRDGLPVTEAIIAQPPTLILEGDPDPAIGCRWCKPDDPRAANYGTAQPWWDKPCTCGGNCGHPYCLAATWAHPW